MKDTKAITDMKYEIKAERLEAIIEKQDEYIKMLGEEINSLSSYVHGWRSSRVEQGEKLRTELASIKSALEEQPEQTDKERPSVAYNIGTQWATATATATATGNEWILKSVKSIQVDGEKLKTDTR